MTLIWNTNKHFTFAGGLHSIQSWITGVGSVNDKGRERRWSNKLFAKLMLKFASW